MALMRGVQATAVKAAAAATQPADPALHVPHLRAVHKEGDVDVAAAKVGEGAIAVLFREHQNEGQQCARQPNDDVLQHTHL